MLSAQTVTTSTTTDADAAAAQPPTQASAAGAITPATTQPTTLYQPGPADSQVGPYYQGHAVTVESIGEREARLNAASLNGVTSVTTTNDSWPVSQAQSGIRAAFAVMRTSNSPSRILDARQIAPSFEQAPYESRVNFAVYDERIQAANGSLSRLANRTAQFSGDMQGRFQQAMNEASAARAQLESSLGAAENATPENWDQARNNLARDYRSYADAVSRAQSLTSS